MRSKRVWASLLGVEQVVVESVRFEPFVSVDGVLGEGGRGDGVLVVSVRPKAGWRSRCGECRRRCPGYDQGRGRRWWRTFDVGVRMVYLEAGAPRVRCPQHGIVVAAVPWARHDAGHTLGFDALVSWFATRMSKTALAAYLRIGWATVGAIITRVMADADTAAGGGDARLDGISRIGVDEISYKRGYKYVTVVVDHDTKRVLWLAEGRSKTTLAGFFTLLGSQRCAQIALVSADGADWIFNAVRDACPNAEICLDPFHVVKWAGDALDEVRRQVWNDDARRHGHTGQATMLKEARWALWKNPDRLTGKQQAKLAAIAKTNQPLDRAYLLKEQLREVFAVGGPAGVHVLDGWLRWAARSRLRPFTELARKIRAYFRDDIVNTLTYRLSNALIESTNTKIRLLTRMAYGFKSVNALIALVKLHLGGYHIDLPGRP